MFLPSPKKVSAQPEPPVRRRLWGNVLRIGAFFVILEPVWMLLPFAGFLYGSVMHIEALSENPYTARLVYFVFPVHSLFPLGLVLVLVGLLVFLTGAIQIYAGKSAQKGLIKTGIYRKFRHPQYLALTIFGLGILLTWGRFISYIAFFIMLWLYYFLARNEEQHCRKLFGREYDAYRATTYFLFPGENLIGAGVNRLRSPNLPAWLGVTASFMLVLGLAIASGLLLISARAESRNTLPVIAGAYPRIDDQPRRIPLLMVKGPALQAAPAEVFRNEFMAKCFAMLTASPGLAKVLSQARPEADTTLLAFLIPGRNWFGGADRDYRQAQINVLIFCVRSPVTFRGDNFQEFRRNWRITHFIKAEAMTHGRLEKGREPAAGKITMEPVTVTERLEERIDFLLSGL
jgi:protein-S-isoprenylcysteine O-methyltransferase Ste14